MTGIPLIIAFVVAVVLMIVAISKFKVHPFLSIMAVSLLLALVAGIPLTKIADVIGAGFSGTFSSIGIVIILGALIGTILEKTGAAFKLADLVIKVVGKKNPELAMELMGWVVSIPVFCDSGFVILDPIRKALVKRTGTSSVAMTVALSAGLYISHVFIPPTPGPIAAAQTLGIGENLLMLTFFAPNHGSEDDKLGALRKAHHLIYDLVNGLPANFSAALGAVGHAHSGPKKAQVVVNFRNRAYRRTGVFGGGLLIDGNGGGETVDGVHIGLVHLP